MINKCLEIPKQTCYNASVNFSRKLQGDMQKSSCVKNLLHNKVFFWFYGSVNYTLYVVSVVTYTFLDPFIFAESRKNVKKFAQLWARTQNRWNERLAVYRLILPDEVTRVVFEPKPS